MDEQKKSSGEKIGKAVGHAVEVSVAWISGTFSLICRKLKECSDAAGERRRARGAEADRKPAAGDVGRVEVNNVHSSLLLDFFMFKFLLFPVIVRLLYFFAVVWWIWYVFRTHMGGPILLTCELLLGPIVIHILFEFLMIPFSILDVNREFRDEMKTFNRQLAELRAAQQRA